MDVFMRISLNHALFWHKLTTFALELSNTTYMTQQYARVSVAMPENEEKRPARQELAYEIENRDINDEFTIKF